MLQRVQQLAKSGHGMSGRPLPSSAHETHRTGGYLLGGASARDRVPPTPGRIARRRFVITLTKWVLPLAAMALLALIALWPEIDAAATKARLAMNHVSGEVEGGKLIDARYNGVDEKGRPYTVTAATAWQIDAERVGLTLPEGRHHAGERHLADADLERGHLHAAC